MVFIGWLVFDEFLWARAREFKFNAVLISDAYHPSTRHTHAVPVVAGKGVGVGVITTGHGSEYITVWDCGKYGRIVVNDENIFRFAKPKSTLCLKERGGEVRVVGIIP
jgi:hypothetical protein